MVHGLLGSKVGCSASGVRVWLQGAAKSGLYHVARIPKPIVHV